MIRAFAIGLLLMAPGSLITALKAATYDQTQVTEVTYLETLWKKRLPQSFADRLVTDLGDTDLTKTVNWSHFERRIAPELPSYLETNAILFRPDQKARLAKLPWQGFAKDLKAWATGRGPDADQALKELGDSHPFLPTLEMGAAYRLAAKGKLDEALAKLEARVKTGRLKPSVLPKYALEIARLRYQKEDFAGAGAWYEKVPLDAPEVAAAREELLWVWLRLGDMGKLLGTVESLKDAEFKNEFMPELYVVRAIANLKLCRYPAVKADIASFIAYNQAWAAKIDGGTASAPPNADWYTHLADRAVQLRKVELDRLKTTFRDEKLGSPLIKDMEAHIARVEASRDAEYRRQSKVNKAALVEAIRKMRFVKVELLTQLNAARAAGSPDLSAAEKDLDHAADGKWSFPFDNGGWKDERFALRSPTSNACL